MRAFRIKCRHCSRKVTSKRPWQKYCDEKACQLSRKREWSRNTYAKVSIATFFDVDVAGPSVYRTIVGVEGNIHASELAVLSAPVGSIRATMARPAALILEAFISALTGLVHQEDVLGLEIPVDEVFFVGRGQGEERGLENGTRRGDRWGLFSASRRCSHLRGTPSLGRDRSLKTRPRRARR